jgi:hypothetical protein
MQLFNSFSKPLHTALPSPLDAQQFNKVAIIIRHRLFVDDARTGRFTFK